MNLQIIKVGNGSKEYAGNFTKREKEIITEEIFGISCNLFSGKSNIGDIRVDFKQPEATINMDVFEYLENCNDKIETFIIDPPYNKRFADKYQKIGNTGKQFIIFANAKGTTKLFDLVRNLNPKRIIIKSWNYFVPKGYKDGGSYLCYAGGYRKPTILMITEKI